MGRDSRAARRRRTRLTVTADGGLKIVIVTGPKVGDGGPSVAEDARLVRSALLYADQVELVSMNSYMLTALAQAAHQGPAFLVELFSTLDHATMRYLGVEGDVEQIQASLAAVRQIQGLPRQQRRSLLGGRGSAQLRGLMDGLNEATSGENGLTAVVERLWSQPGGEDLVIATEAGLLSIALDPFHFETDGPSLQLEPFIERLKLLLSDPSSHIMLDEQIASLAAAMLRESDQAVNPIAARHAKQAATGAGLVEHLPAFPDANIKDVIAARDDLRKR